MQVIASYSSGGATRGANLNMRLNTKEKRQLENAVYELVLESRGDRIRTCDLVLPKHPRYQAAPRPAHKILVHNSHL